MSATYFAESPRGFANEITIYAVRPEYLDEFRTRFPNAWRITRKQAIAMDRADRGRFQTDPESGIYPDHIAQRYSRLWMEEAMRGTYSVLKQIEAEERYAVEMEAQYAEFITP